MVVKTEVKTLKEVDFSELLQGQSVYVGYPENSHRTDTNLTDAQIAFLNTNGTRPNKVSKEIKDHMESHHSSYNDALSAYIRSKGEPRWHIPPRPFVEPAIENELDKISLEFKKTILNSLEGLDIKESLIGIGLRARNSVQKFLRNYPANELTPNAPSTIKRKGEDHPLKGDTGSLLSHVTYIVNE